MASPACPKLFLRLAGALLTLLTIEAAADLPSATREIIQADSGWKFSRGDVPQAETRTFDDTAWRTVNLPHDWSIEFQPDPKNLSGSGGGFFPAGVGWYRKTFTAPRGWAKKSVSIEFDGVYENATVYLNGSNLGTHGYGYTSFSFDLSPHLKPGKVNILAVRVDNSAQPNSRWYTGSGIYRHVRLVATDPIHVAQWGVSITTPDVSTAQARLLLRTSVVGVRASQKDLELKTTILSPSGAKVAETHSPIERASLTQSVTLTDPALWSLETPQLYHAVTQITRNAKILDEIVTPFGIRSLSWSVDKGFLLNGKSVKLHGGSVHHDNGPLGSAAFDRAEERKVELLKAAGNNAVRTAHNPPSPAFLDACDRLGLLVLEDAFDVWTRPKVKFDYSQYFEKSWRDDLDSMILRDRNHPSIVMWGMGNEIPEAWTPAGAPIAKKLSERIRELDTTRPITEAFPGATYTPSTDAVFAQTDIGGYNYNLAANHAKDHVRVPGRIMLTTESFPSDAFEQWKLAHDYPYILGELVWTSMDYLGESGIGAWKAGTPQEASQAEQMGRFVKVFTAKMGEDGKSPFSGGAPASNPMFPGYPWHGSYCGDLDITGFRKGESYYRDILWNGGDRVYATVRLPDPEGKKIFAIGWAVFPTIASWTWPGYEKKDMQVEVYSSADRVRLLLNDAPIGEMPTGRDQQFKATFTVPYAPGTLRAEALRSDRVVAEMNLKTAGPATALRLTPDRTMIHSDGQDLSFVTVEAIDAAGQLQPNADQEVEFALSGPGVIAAVGTGDTKSPEPYQANRRSLFHGRALVVVRSSGLAGSIQLTAKSKDLSETSVTIATQQ